MSDADQPVRRSLWNSPGSFLKSRLPLSERDNVIRREGTSQAELSHGSTTHVCFTAPGLSISEARRHPPVKNGLHQRLSSEPGARGATVSRSGKRQRIRGRGRGAPVDHLVGGVLIKGVIKAEGLVLQVPGQVHFLLGLMDHDHVFTGNGDHVQFLHGGLYGDTEQTPSDGWTRTGLVTQIWCLLPFLLSGRARTHTHILCSSIWNGNFRSVTEFWGCCPGDGRRKTRQVQTYGVVARQGSVVQTGSEVSDHTHDLIVWHVNVHLLEGKKQKHESVEEERPITLLHLELSPHLGLLLSQLLLLKPPLFSFLLQLLHLLHAVGLPPC